MDLAWPDSLISDIARRRSVLFLGAGISCNSVNAAGQRPKLWAAFLDLAVRQVTGSQAKKKAIRELIKKADYLNACQVIRDSMGTTNFHQLAESEFLAPGFQAAPIHDVLIEIDSRIVATPNFDTIFDHRINHQQHNTVPIKNYYDNDVAEKIRSNSRLVLKVHGSIETPNKMIFTRDDYTNARHRYASFYHILEALAVTHTFLFLGCGLDDPDIRLLLEDYAFRHEYSKPHFFVVPKSNVHKDVLPSLKQSLNIEFLTYSAPNGDHTQLFDGLNVLRDQVLDERNDLTITQNW